MNIPTDDEATCPGCLVPLYDDIHADDCWYVKAIDVAYAAGEDAYRTWFVAWLREHAGDTNCLDDCELFTEYAGMIERREI